MADDMPLAYHDLSYTLLDRAALRLALVARVWHGGHFRFLASELVHGPEQPDMRSGRRESNPHDQLGRSTICLQIAVIGRQTGAELGSALAASDRGVPAMTRVNGTLMA